MTLHPFLFSLSITWSFFLRASLITTGPWKMWWTACPFSKTNNELWMRMKNNTEKMMWKKEMKWKPLLKKITEYRECGSMLFFHTISSSSFHRCWRTLTMNTLRSIHCLPFTTTVYLWTLQPFESPVQSALSLLQSGECLCLRRL